MQPADAEASSSLHVPTLATLLPAFFPPPQQVRSLDAICSLPGVVRLLLKGPHRRLRPAAEQITSLLKETGRSCQWTAYDSPDPSRPQPHITLQLRPALFSQQEAYRLVVHGAGVTLSAGDEAGLFYAAVTFGQLLRACVAQLPEVSAPLAIPGLCIEDAPDFPNRGVMLDVSRDKVPEMKTLFALIDLLASWKFNQLQLYMEHTFAYEGHEQVWADASPFTGAEIMALDVYCQARHIELVPNQNSFGHMHRWLMHEEYKELAECPEGIQHPFNRRTEPFGLCPIEPKSLAFLDDLYAQLLPHFQSDLFNVGLDETFDLGHGRSKERCEAQGTDQVYLQFVREIGALARKHGKTIQFWADIVLKHEESIAHIPSDAIGMIWGYEANHAFEKECRALSEVGLAFYVCPGTSSWNSFAGRTDNAIGNLKVAAQQGKAFGAQGMLLTDWGDFGHMQPLPVSYLGYMAGAGFSWNAEGTAPLTREEWCRLLDQYVFADRAGVLGGLFYDLGNAYLQTGARHFNASPLFRLLVLSDRHAPKDIEHVSVESLAKNKAFIETLVPLLEQVESQREDSALLVQEWRWAADILCLACDFATARIEHADEEQSIQSLPADVRAALAARLEVLIEQHKKQWLSRNRPGGLVESVGQLTFVLEQLRA